jgi:tripartite-type tricarboxylate transporter receptor subunit TctC
MLAHRLRALVGSIVLVAVPLVASAQGIYPSKSLRVLVGARAGGATDLVARLVGEQLARQLGQSVNVENRDGDGGNLAAETAAKAVPDGYTLFVGAAGTMTINPFVYADLPFDPLADFAPVTQLTALPLVLVVHPSVPAKNLKEFVAWAKSAVRPASYGSHGHGTQAHLAGEMLKSMAGIDLVHVPYQGTEPALADLLGGRVAATFDRIAPSLPHLRAGRLVAIGVTTARRSSVAPGIPTLAESGVPGYEATGWHGLFVPAGTPKEIVDRLNAETIRALAAPELAEELARHGIEPAPSTPAQLGAMVRSELDRWRETARAAGIRPR